jgi:hypothetical protein
MSADFLILCRYRSVVALYVRKAKRPWLLEL